MSSLIEKLVFDAIDEYERLAAENKRLAEALRAEWQSLQVDQPVDQSVDPDGWIEWTGGECPVAEGTPVEARLRNGDESYREDGMWFRWRWVESDHPYYATDIVAYKVVS